MHPWCLSMRLLFYFNNGSCEWIGLWFSRVKGKRTPSKNLDGKKGISKRKQWGSRERESSDVSNIEPNLVSKVDEMNSGKVSCMADTQVP